MQPVYVCNIRKQESLGASAPPKYMWKIRRLSGCTAAQHYVCLTIAMVLVLT